MDIVAEMPAFHAMLDIRCFVSTLKSGWRSTRFHEIEKHTRYGTHEDGRRFCNMELFVAVVNTYGCIGNEFNDICATTDTDKRGSSRGRSLRLLLSLLGVYANAEKVLLVHAPSSQHEQRNDMLSAIAGKNAALAAAEASRPAVGVPNAEKDAALAAAQASRPPVGVPRARPAAAPAKPGAAPAEKRGPGNFKHLKRPDIRGEITGTSASATEPERGMIHCIACNKLMKYNSWTYHRRTKHPESVVDENAKNGNDYVDHIDDTDESKK